MDFFQEVDGELVTGINCQLPGGCSDEFNQMGADEVWGQDGMIKEQCLMQDLEGDIKPLFSIIEIRPTHFFKVGDEGIYGFSENTGEFFKTKDPDNVVGIVGRLKEAELMVAALLTEPMSLSLD
ncbi:hypothetical protein FVEN_g6798 [Fusarium venenatum]|uniref:Uncharacterized protein n=1 Tax=Fusarium venenatum TaxID=56646 RepID=A0A2L2TKN0_9HYPO|nr:uncharacterized protein FVRRES_00188 [Fusarium venenatum]KAG8355300.1 hypothetical protein FVEN_g6798 [Fusarium venenatum]CEI63676.1 unnamed protein product [Fusarium venenatum]